MVRCALDSVGQTPSFYSSKSEHNRSTLCSIPTLRSRRRPLQIHLEMRTNGLANLTSGVVASTSHVRAAGLDRIRPFFTRFRTRYCCCACSSQRTRASRVCCERRRRAGFRAPGTKQKGAVAQTPLTFSAPTRIPIVRTSAPTYPPPVSAPVSAGIRPPRRLHPGLPRRVPTGDAPRQLLVRHRRRGQQHAHHADGAVLLAAAAVPAVPAATRQCAPPYTPHTTQNANGVCCCCLPRPANPLSP